MANNRSSSRTLVPEARQALDNMKFEIANQLGVTLNPGYNGDIRAKDAGYIGGYMVKRMIEQAEMQMAGNTAAPTTRSTRLR
ncbi:MAG: small, acid-soluble spore protein, alpha/beta type [Clostridia bacterium]|jgi:hypothetical protein